jgi:hypothetical protein
LRAELEDLGEILSEIPDSRKMSYVEEVNNGITLGKPRFDPPKFQLYAELDTRITSFLNNLKKYFLSRNYSIRDDLEVLFDTEQLHSNKFSPIFLLENDVWNTDAVYGLYLIEIDDNETGIYYFRRNQKRLKLEYDGSNIEEFIIQDARNQIKREFNFLWDQLNKEIQLADEYYELSRVVLTGKDLDKLLESSKFLTDVNPIAACLMLGRAVEIFCRIILKNNSRMKLAQMLRKLKDINMISANEYVIMEKIRSTYNRTKHVLNYEIDPSKIDQLWSKFYDIVSRVINGKK